MTESAIPAASEARTGITETDVLIVGSGPTGAAVARALHDASAGLRMRMVDVGPAASTPWGRNIRNLPAADRPDVRRSSQGAHPDQRSAGALPGGRRVEGTITAREGTHLVDQPAGFDDMPAAAHSSVVGGQGVHWTGAVPRPKDSEIIDAIDRDEWDEVIARAERLLHATTEVHPPSLAGAAVQLALGEELDELLAGRHVGPLPSACHVRPDGSREWTGVDTILGPLLTTSAPAFSLSADTLCRRLITEHDRVTGAELVHLPTGEVETVHARAVVVAADAVRTPQLLWASGIRPAALGRYLTEHPLVFGVVGLDPAVLDRGRAAFPGIPDELTWSADEPIGAMLHVPFAEPEHPFHAQIMVMGQPPFPVDEEHAAPAYVLVGWGCRQQPSPENRLEFFDDLDSFGMPRVGIHYRLADQDLAEIERATAIQALAAKTLGGFLPGGEPHHMPAGSSLHYQGTVRIGREDDGTSVCDTWGAVWGADNLYVAGNGLIPKATACNPTLTSVALALRTAERIVERLR